MRVFLDTNVLVAAFTTRGLCADLLRTVLAEHTMVTGDVVVQEIRKVLASRFKLPAETIDDVVELLHDQAFVPKPKRPAPLAIRDPDDRWILASAIEGRADVLVTGDRDLLDAAPKSPIRILDPRGLWDLLRQPR